MRTNDPPYILTDVFAEIVTAVKAALSLTVLNYQFGTFDELRSTLKQYGGTETYEVQKFPLVWVQQPFDIQREVSGAYYGTYQNGKVFVVNQNNNEDKAKKRVDLNFKPVIYPIYYELLKQIDLHVAFATMNAQLIEHVQTDRYAIEELNDVVDCVRISELKLKIYNQQNCD